MNNYVLIITTHYPPNIGGVESHLQALIEGLIKRKWDVVISTYQPLATRIKAPQVEKSDRLTIYRMPWPGFNLVHLLFHYPLLEFLYLFPGLFLVSFWSLIKHNKEIIVIHCQGLVPTVVGLILGKMFAKRIISSTHNLYFFPKTGLYKNFARLIFSFVDKILTPTKVAKKELTRIGVPSDKIQLFRYWVNLQVFTPLNKQSAKQKLGWKRFTVFFVGRLIETKGVNLLLEAIKNTRLNIDFVIAGTGPLKSSIQQMVNNVSNLRYLGRIENQNLPLYYSAADVVVVPSLVDEGFGFVVMESVACGTPVLASNKGGLADAVSKETGRLFQPTPRKLRDYLSYIQANKKVYDKMKNSCRKYALENFSAANIIDIIKAYG